MEPLPYGLTPKDKELLDVLYNYGRGYATEILLRPFFNLKSAIIQRRLKKLLELKLLKYTANKQQRIYIMSKLALDMYPHNNYLVRMRARNETKNVVQDKLNQLNYYGYMRDKEIQVVLPYQKILFFEKVHGISTDKLNRFHVGKGKQIFFNDVFVVPKEDKYKTLFIALFPRENIYPETYISEFLIRQYYYINYLFRSLKKQIKFVIVTNIETKCQNYEKCINNINSFKILPPEMLNEELKKHYINDDDFKYRLNPNARKKIDNIPHLAHAVSIKHFDINIKYINFPHSKIA